MEKSSLVYIGEMKSPIDMLTIACIDEGVCYVAFGSIGEVEWKVKRWADKHLVYDDIVHDTERTAEPIQQLQEYFSGERRTFTVQLCLKGTSFQKQVWQALQNIGYGETCSYKNIAEAIGNPKAVRAVGSSNGKNPVSIFIPCHRVIGSNGGLVGYGGGLSNKKILLELEQEFF